MKVPNIKFNLKFYDAKGGEIVVRTMYDLRAKANLSDLYDYYKDGTLSKWLLSIGEGATAAAVDKLELSDSDADGVKQLTSALGIEVPESDLTEFVKVLQLQSRLQRKQRDQPDAAQECQPVDSYLNLLQQLIDNPNDFIVVRGIVEKIMEKYPDKFREDLPRIGEKLVKLVPVLLSVVISKPVWRVWLVGALNFREPRFVCVGFRDLWLQAEVEPYFERVAAKPSSKDVILQLSSSQYLVLKPEWKI